MKLFAGLLCAVLFMVIGTTTNAQTPYTVANSTPVPVNGFFVQTTCGAIGSGYNGAVPPPYPQNGINITGTGATHR